jgi:Na+/H+ antiporter NhaC
MTFGTGPRRIFALIPFFTFLVLYIAVGVWLSLNGADMAFYQFPAASCALIGFGVALMLGWRNVGEQVQTFTKGIGEETIILMCLIFLLAGAFATVTKAMGGVDATVHLGLSILPSALVLPGLFLIACFVSMAMGTSMGTISTVVPIALGIAAQTDLSLPLTVGTVVGGAMFGDNLSLISDTTVAATSSQGCDMKEKMLANLKIALPAAIVVLIALFYFGSSADIPVAGGGSLIPVIPYAAVLALALMGFNVIVVLMIGTALAASIGMAIGSFDFVQVGKLTYQGFESMAEVFFVTVLVAGLAAIATKEGGLDLIVEKLRPWLRSKRSAEAGIAAFVSTADLCVANNTIAIIVTGKVVKQISDEQGIAPARAASLLDIFSCVWQGLIPYGAQILLAGSLSQIQPFQIIPFVWYPIVLGIAAIIAIIIQRPYVASR